METDAQLLAASRRDAGAFDVLYARHAAAILRFHLRRSGDEDAAHELTAETFAQAWIARERFRDERDGSAAPWLFGIARNVLALSVRRRRLEQAARDRLGMEAHQTVEPEDGWLEGLDEALGALPADQRRAVELRVVDDLAYVQLASALGTTPGAARVRVHRGLRSLRRRLEDHR